MSTTRLVAKNLTYADYLEMPEMHCRYDIVDGEFIAMTAAPVFIHQWIIKRLIELLDRHVERYALGVVVPAPTDIVIRKEPRVHTRQPDVLFISAERGGTLDNLAGAINIQIAPDLVVEILSTDEMRRELPAKLHDYCMIGVSEAWVISPVGRTLEVLRLTRRGAKQLSLHGAGDVVASRVLPHLKLRVSKLFE